MKRTQKLDDEKEIPLGIELNGKPGFVKAGTLRTTEDEKAETADNIALAAYEGEVKRAVESIAMQAQEIAQQVLANIAPQSFWDAYEAVEQKNSQQLMTDWILENQFQVIIDWDRLVVVVKANGKVLLDAEPSVRADLRSAVSAKGKELHNDV